MELKSYTLLQVTLKSNKTANTLGVKNIFLSVFLLFACFVTGMTTMNTYPCSNAIQALAIFGWQVCTRDNTVLKAVLA